MNQILGWSIITVFILWLIYWRFVHPKIKFKDKKYRQNKNLLKLEYERLNQHTYHVEIIGFSFLISGFTTLTNGTINFVPWVLITMGGTFLMMAFMINGRAERRYLSYKKLIT